MKIKHFVAFLLMFLFAFFAFQTPSLSEGDWKTAYLNVLKQEKGVKRAASLCDLTGDGVPELIMVSASSGVSKVSVYTLSNGQAKAFIKNAAPFSQKNAKSISIQYRGNACISISQSISGGKELIGYRYDASNGSVTQIIRTLEVKKNGKIRYSIDGVQVAKTNYTSSQKNFDSSYKKIAALSVKAFAAKDKDSTVNSKFKQLTNAYASFSKVKSIKLNKKSLTLSAGKTYTLSAKRSPATAVGDAVSFTSSNTGVATVDGSSGKVTAVSGGKAVITAVSASGAKSSATVTVNAPAASGVELSEKAIALTKGESCSLKGAVSPNTANQSLKFTSSNPEVVSVTDDGSVKALRSGKSTITAKTSNNKTATCSVVVTSGPAVVVDLSQHNYSTKMDWKKIAENVDLLIIRCGVTRTDTEPIGVGKDDRFEYYAKQCKAYNIPFGVYYYGKCEDEETAIQEAKMTWALASPYNPLFYVYDAEESRLTKPVIETYMKTLRSLGAKKTGYYIAHHLYSKYKLDTSLVDFIWIPHYGSNTGSIESAPSYPCDLHQYTSNGKIEGFPGRVDVSRLMGTKDLEWFLK